MLPVSQDLYRSTSYAPPINLSFNQYLLLSEEPVLFHTGSARQATELLPRLEGVHAGKALSYIFVSHVENTNAVADLPYPLDTAFPLFKSSWVPRKVKIDKR